MAPDLSFDFDYYAVDSWMMNLDIFKLMIYKGGKQNSGMKAVLILGATVVGPRMLTKQI